MECHIPRLRILLPQVSADVSPTGIKSFIDSRLMATLLFVVDKEQGEQLLSLHSCFSSVLPKLFGKGSLKKYFRFVEKSFSLC